MNLDTYFNLLMIFHNIFNYFEAISKDLVSPNHLTFFELFQFGYSYLPNEFYLFYNFLNTKL